MKSNYNSLKALVQAVLSIAFLAIGFNRASAQTDPVANHAKSEKLPEGQYATIPCAFCVNQPD